LLIKIFPITPKAAHSNSSKIFSHDLIEKSFNVQKKLHYKSKRYGTKPMHPSLSRALQKHQEHDLKHPSLVDLIIAKRNKTNYLPLEVDGKAKV
jgi:hypothetical protein